MIEIVEYKNEYAKDLSEIILDNMYKINIKEHGKDIIDRISKYFTEDEIKKNFPQRTKCLVALKNEKVVGTASIDRYKGDKTGKKYIVLTVFVKIKNHRQGIGKDSNNEKASNVKETKGKTFIPQTGESYICIIMIIIVIVLAIIFRKKSKKNK